MDAVYTYINVLRDTLQKKKNVLEQILAASQQQKIILQKEAFDEEAFMQTISVKEKLLIDLEKLDQGFEQIYERVSLAIKHNKDKYKNEILEIQKLIQQIIDLGVSIRVLEEENKNRFPICLTQKKSHIRNFKVSSRAVTNYYKNMPNIHQDGQSYFMDKKK